MTGTIERDNCCRTCAFWMVQHEDYRQQTYSNHQCVRHAPTVAVTIPQNANAVFPRTFGNAYCGDYEYYKDRSPSSEVR